jgi:hypothetical protein
LKTLPYQEHILLIANDALPRTHSRILTIIYSAN